MRTTVVVLRSDPDLDVPDVLRDSLPTPMTPGVSTAEQDLLERVSEVREPRRGRGGRGEGDAFIAPALLLPCSDPVAGYPKVNE